MDRKAFFDAVRERPFGGSLTQAQVNGINDTLDACIWHGIEDEDAVAHILGEECWETGRTMQPVRETFAGSDAQAVARLENAWKRGRLPWVKTPYWRRDRNGQHPYGRGLVQITWPENYERADRELGLGGALIANYDLALDPRIAANIAVVGMRDGWFTSKKLAHYFQPGDDPESDQVAARRIVNGTNKAKEIAELAEAFERALEAAGGWSLQAAQKPQDAREPRRMPSPAQTPPPPPMGRAEPSTGGLKPFLILALVIGLIAAGIFLFG